MNANKQLAARIASAFMDDISQRGDIPALEELQEAALLLIANHDAEREQELQNALDGYWRTHPDLVSAARAAVADVNKYRTTAFALRDSLNTMEQLVRLKDGNLNKEVWVEILKARVLLKEMQ